MSSCPWQFQIADNYIIDVNVSRLNFMINEIKTCKTYFGKIMQRFLHDLRNILSK